jgi:hypothetical protein
MDTLWVDFQNAGHDGVRLICNGTLADLKEKGIELRDGLQLLIWSEDYDDNGNPDNLSVEAVVRYSNSDKCWVAQYDNKKLMNESKK